MIHVWPQEEARVGLGWGGDLVWRKQGGHCLLKGLGRRSRGSADAGGAACKLGGTTQS